MRGGHHLSQFGGLLPVGGDDADVASHPRLGARVTHARAADVGPGLRAAAGLGAGLVAEMGGYAGMTPGCGGEARVAMLTAFWWAIVTEAGAEPVGVTFDALVVALAQRKGATILIRGLRDATDFDYEM